jgi:hypothetical protein
MITYVMEDVVWDTLTMIEGHRPGAPPRSEIPYTTGNQSIHYPPQFVSACSVARHSLARRVRFLIRRAQSRR